MPKVRLLLRVDHGVCYSAVRELEDGREVDRISSWLMPNIMSVPDIRFKAGYSGSRVVGRAGGRLALRPGLRHEAAEGRCDVKDFALRNNGKTWGEMSEAERQRFPGDFEAQAGQGPISLHSEEHLVTSDRGIMLQRRMLEKQIDVVREGGDPVGVHFDAAKALVHVRSGNFYRAARAAG